VFLSGVTAVREGVGDRAQAMRKWRELNNVDTHVLFEMQPTWRVTTLESYLASESSLAG
jgi:hypothetical protein